MNPFTALGLAGAVVQFTDFGTKFGRNVISMHRENRPQSSLFFTRTAEDLRLVTDLMKKSKNQQPGDGTAPPDQNQKVIQATPCFCTL